MMAWAHCPNCSPTAWNARAKTYDKRVRVDADETHTGVVRRCPNCDKRVRLSIGSPIRKVVR